MTAYEKRLQNNKGYDLFDRNDIRQVFFVFLEKLNYFSIGLRAVL